MKSTSKVATIIIITMITTTITVTLIPTAMVWRTPIPPPRLSLS